MTSAQLELNARVDKQQVKIASSAALASLLNLTFLPIISFIWLLLNIKHSQKKTLSHYHLMLGIKLNIAAALALGVVSILMILFGGFESAWTWVYVITYFTLIHTVFIVISIWALTRAWAGKTLK